MKILLVLTSLNAGGAERVMSNMANFWAEHGHEIILVTQSPTGSDFYPLDDHVHRLSTQTLISSRNALQAIVNNLQRIFRLRKIIRDCQPQVIISFLTRDNIMTILAATGLRIPVIVSERIDPIRFPVNGIWGLFRRLTYSRAKSLVVLSEENRIWFTQNVLCPVETIPNAISGNQLVKGCSSLEFVGGEQNQTHLVAAVGRLDPQKGFDILLKSWALVHPQFPDWRLAILGEGTLRAELEQLADQLAVSTSVSFLGLIKDPSRVLQQGDLFVLSSRYEGFPNALIEAMACELPVIATRCTGSISEIVRDGQDGLLVPVEDIPALAEAMQRLMSDPDLRCRMAESAAEVTQRYSMNEIMAKWEALIAKVSSQADL